MKCSQRRNIKKEVETKKKIIIENYKTIADDKHSTKQQ